MASVMSRTSMSRLVNARRSPSLASMASTAVAGSLTAGESARSAMSARTRIASMGSWSKDLRGPGRRPCDHVVGNVATVYVGDEVLVQGVADPDAERDDGTRPAGGVDEVEQIELLDDPDLPFQRTVRSRGSARGDGVRGRVPSVARNGYTSSMTARPSMETASST